MTLAPDPAGVLRDGTVVHLRPLRPEDRDDIASGFEALSMTSRYQRFFTPMRQLSPAMLRTLVDAVDDVDHVARVMYTAPVPGTEDAVGIGRFVRDATRPDTADVALTIGDDWQGKGAGTLLMTGLRDAARRRDVRFFTASVLAGNTAAIRVVEHAGTVVDRRPEGATVQLRVDLA